MILHGSAYIGLGFVIDVKKNATLTLGKGFRAVGQSTIICHRGILFGDNCLMSWDCLIMDRDYHALYDFSKTIINKPKRINIGNKVWLGCKSTILKGCTIGDNTVIAACSTITKSIRKENVVIGGTGNDVKILKEGITWDIKEEIEDENSICNCT